MRLGDLLCMLRMDRPAAMTMKYSSNDAWSSRQQVTCFSPAGSCSQGEARRACQHQKCGKGASGVIFRLRPCSFSCEEKIIVASDGTHRRSHHPCEQRYAGFQLGNNNGAAVFEDFHTAPVLCCCLQGFPKELVLI